ncbi:MAG: twin-arginine translocase TatA/TatE family subunit [Planctomycetes bacterium]|nr:twin-arginine translocase TatA/TatE family subunit [Planctomycetota bacterium]
MPLGTPEMIIILVVALLIFGKRLPATMRSLGKSVNSFKKGMHEVTDLDADTTS